jgi:hypothetical protein
MLLLLSRDNSVGIAAGYGLDGLGSIPDRGKILLVSTSSRPESTLHPLRWAPGAFSQEVKLLETTGYLYLVPRSRIHGSIHPLPHIYLIS